MSIPGAASPLFLATTGAADAFEISRSLRFNSGDSAYLNRTPSSAGNRKTWTWSAWVKRSALGSATTLFSADASNSDFITIRFESDTIRVDCQGDGQGRVQVTTTAVYRDPASFFNLVIALDTTQSTAADRCKIYVNSVLQATSNTLSQNKNFAINATVGHEIGRRTDGNDHYFDGYLAECILVDGSQLGPTSFGAFDANGVWQAKDTAGLTFGTNGFRLQFADNSGSTATTLGKDTSGNSNNWTPNNLVASSVVYSANTTSTGAANSPTTAFDGATGPRWSVTCESTSNFLGVTFNPPLVGQLSVVSYSSNASTFQYEVNGSNVGTAHTGYDSLTEDNLGTYSSITSFKYKVATTSSGTQGGFSQLKLGGTVLVDGNPADIDSLVDTPTNGDTASDTGSGGQITGNYATWNPLDNGGNTLKDGNLVINGADKNCKSTIAVSSGKWYFEQTGRTSPGIALASTSAAANTDNYQYQYDGNLYHLSGGGYTTTSGGASFGEGDIIGVALDLDNNQLKLYKNGALQSALTKTIAAGTYCFMARSFFNTDHPSNFGQRAFAYTAPSGYKSLNTANLPTPTIADGSLYFDTKLYTGDGANSRTISGYGFSPDFLWVKERGNSGGDFSHRLMDAVRGAGVSLRSNGTDTERDHSAQAGGGIETFTSNGFTIEQGTSTNNNQNNNNSTYVAWAWDAGTSTVTNNDGSIASQVRANPTAGFSIVSYSANNAAVTVGHGLNAAPSLIIAKGRNASLGWKIYHQSLGVGGFLEFDTGAFYSFSNYWGSSVNSSTFGVSAGGDIALNDMIAYCFAPVLNYSAMGSFEGNGNANGPFVYLGFKPALIILKLIEGVNSSWKIYDNTRDPDNPIEKQLYPNSSNAEPSDDARCDFLSNGFKVRTAGSEDNYNNNTFIYYAVAENPFQANGGLAR